jgi:hypothetical protein
VNSASRRQHAHELQLNLAGPVREVLGQRVEPEVDEPHREHDDDEEDDHRAEEAVGLSRRRDEERQMASRGRFNIAESSFTEVLSPAEPCCPR